MRTHNIHLHVVQQWGGHDATAEHLYLAEPFPAGRMQNIGAIEEYARIFRVARRTRAQAQQDTAKGLVAEVQAVTQSLLEGWAVQEWEKEVDSGEVEADEMVDQVRLWKGETRRVEVEGSAFPLQKSDEQGKGRNDMK
jgi:hypothetical protein